jgi:tRNA(Ile)-lysidine synthase
MDSIVNFDTMLERFRSFIRDKSLFSPGQRILLAVSGGVDSVVMTDLFHKAGFSFAIAHANFHLRGKESGRDENFARDLAGRYQAEIYVKNFDTARIARKRKLSIQVTARELRYEWFDELLTTQSFDFIATAHHLDDQVETFLINLARGTGIAGLHGIPVRQGRIIRPMMFTGRDDIENYARMNDIDFVEDSSNRSDKYTRNRIRHHVIPQLEKLNTSFRQTLTETIDNLRNAEIIYRNAIEEKRNSIFEIRKDAILIPADSFYSLDPIAAWAYELLSPFGFNQAKILDIIGLENAIPGKEVLSSSHRLIKDRDRLIIVPRELPGKNVNYLIEAEDIRNDVVFPVHLHFDILDQIPASFDDPHNTAYLDLDKLEFPLQVRKWKRGEYFYPLGMSQRKKLSDFFIDLKFSKIDKENQWLLCSGDEIAWVIGHRIDDRFKVKEGSCNVLKIRVNLSHLR